MSVSWLPWGEAAFARAAAENKPVLLSISAVWCHWCHVMDRTTYADADVATAIAERFIPVRVDNDERPDINARYNMGGWPTTAFLGSDGAILTGATYLPPAQMRRALEEIAEFYATHRDEIARRSAEVAAPRGQSTAQPAAIGVEPAERLREALEAQYDDEYGGFGDAPKFPQPEALEFLLLEWRLTGDARLFDIVVRTMREMSRGGMYDHVEGGFFRYSTTRDWSVPHFEKMAEDHAGLIRVLAQLLLWGRAADVRPTLSSTLRYVRTNLRNPATALFNGSQDADEAYYAKPLEERRESAEPFIDRRSYVDWSAELCGAFCWAGTALDDESLFDEAAAGLDAIDGRLRDGTGLLYHVLASDGTPSVRGLFADQAAYVRALLDAFEATGEERFLERAASHAARTVEAFGAPDGGFYDHRSDDAIGRLALPDRPIVDNGLFADSLLRLTAITGDGRNREIASRALAIYAQTAAAAGAFGATYARALRRYAAQATVVYVGDAPCAPEIREAARRLPDPMVSIGASGAAASHLCVGTRCGEPFVDAAELRARYDALTG